MLFIINPSTNILVTISIFICSMTISHMIFVAAFITIAISPCINTLTFKFTINPSTNILWGKGSELACDRYEGSWKNSNRNGHGTYKFADGRKYVGGWVDSKFEG